MFKHIGCSYFFTVLRNYVIGWCDMVFNIDSNKGCTYFHRNMNIHCVLHIGTFWFPCSITLGEGEQPQNRGQLFLCGGMKWYFEIICSCTFARPQNLNLTAILLSSLHIVIIFIRNLATPLPPTKKSLSMTNLPDLEKCTFSDKNCYK